MYVLKHFLGDRVISFKCKVCLCMFSDRKEYDNQVDGGKCSKPEKSSAVELGLGQHAPAEGSRGSFNACLLPGLHRARAVVP